MNGSDLMLLQTFEWRHFKGLYSHYWNWIEQSSYRRSSTVIGCWRNWMSSLQIDEICVYRITSVLGGMSEHRKEGAISVWSRLRRAGISLLFRVFQSKGSLPWHRLAIARKKLNTSYLVRNGHRLYGMRYRAIVRADYLRVVLNVIISRAAPEESLSRDIKII